MFRCSSVLLMMLLSALAVLTGCLGNSTPNTAGAGVKSISLAPSGTLSIEIGSVQSFSATAVDGNGHAIIGADIQFIVSSPPGSTTPPPLSITTAGTACAGTWDSTQTLCSAGNDGIAIVTAVANGVRSPQTTAYVHKHIDSLQVSQAQTLPPTYDCFSQDQTWLYQGTAYSNGVDITNTVGPLIWTSTNAGVISTNTNPSLPVPLPLNQVQITAASPGVTQLSASISGTSSTPIPIATCLVQYVRLQASGTTASSVNVTSGTSVSLQATAVDTLGFTLTKPPLTWISSDPEVVSFPSLTTATGTNSAAAHANQGGADISAVCAPPSCNIGVVPNVTIPLTSPPYKASDPSAMPVYVFASDGPVSPSDPLQAFGTISVDVINTANPTFTAWAATDLCGGATVGCTSVMFAVTPTTSGGTNPIGTTVVVPRTPNSILFNHQSRIYLGSDQGLMYFDVGGTSLNVIPVSPASTPCNVALCGTLLALSSDGKQVVVSDATNPATPEVYIYNGAAPSGANPVTSLVLPSVATSAAFSPDQSKIFIVTKAGTMYVYSTVSALEPVMLPATGTGVEFSADGSFAYIPGASGASGILSAFSTCGLKNQPSVNLGNVATAGIPVKVFASPITQAGPDLLTQNLLMLESAPGATFSDPPLVENVQILTAQFKQSAIADGQFTCNPPSVSLSVGGSTFSLHQGPIIPVYARLVANGAEMILVARYIPAVLIFNVANGTTTAVQLVNSDDPRWASASSDGSQVFVGACDQYVTNSNPPVCSAGSVHIVNTIKGTDQQVPYINNSTNNMCSGQGAGAPVCFPDLIAIKPQ